MSCWVSFISFHELGLKGKNRSTFERRLADNLNAALDSWRDAARAGGGPEPAVGRATRIAGRLTVAVQRTEDLGECVRRLSVVPGVVSVSPARKCGRDVTEIKAVALTALQAAIERTAGADGVADELREPRATKLSFKVVAKRSSTDFPIPSMELASLVGAHLVEATGLSVRMKDPDITVRITVVEGSTYVSTEKQPGIGGLPSGSSGKLVSLLSSGIDSPVATWRMLKRGAVLLALHFSGRPQTGDASERLVADICRVLAETGGLARLYVIPFGDIQRTIASTVAPAMRVIMYRRLMLVIATRLARAQGAKALVTGESLGQVASQTLDNLLATDASTDMMILRPLIGSDKQEITAEARRIGTFDLSIQDADDCCTLFMPRSPETHAKPAAVAQNWELLDVESLVQQALDGLEVTEFTDRFGAHKARGLQPATDATVQTRPADANGRA
ncbi:MAG: tRNA 4-thiouridine(8) synthase ThiI [Actinomycetes bacterium]|jgi:thiamine biosynthesis protein ThiI|nr:tRNA 4-thiouridine(8) synthase ThiI [Actinomycetes bacterium]